MATLTQVASGTRKIIKFGSIGLVLFFTLRMLLLTGIAYWQKLHPPPPPPPTVEFGKLKKIIFPEQEIKNYNFELQLPTLEFPGFSDRAKVFVVPYKKPSFSAWDEARKQAEALGFLGEPEQISPQVFHWTIKNPITTTLQMNIIDGSFEYNYAWQEDPNILQGKNLPGEQQAIAETKDFLRKIKPSEWNIFDEEAKVVYLKAVGNKIEPAVSLSEADLVQVNLFRPKLDEVMVVTPNPGQGVVSALLSGSNTQRVIKVSFNYFPVNSSLFATYPIKTPQKAWQDLQDGRGYFAVIPETTDIIVRRVYLGYYDSLTPQPYLQPVYIFTGDNDFIGYVPAVVDQWLQDSAN